jgi:hypothetical protein
MERQKGWRRRQSVSKKGSGGRVTRDGSVEPTIYLKAMEEKRRLEWINATSPNRNKGSRWVNSHQLDGGER